MDSPFPELLPRSSSLENGGVPYESQPLPTLPQTFEETFGDFPPFPAPPRYHLLDLKTGAEALPALDIADFLGGVSALLLAVVVAFFSQRKRPSSSAISVEGVKKPMLSNSSLLEDEGEEGDMPIEGPSLNLT